MLPPKLCPPCWNEISDVHDEPSVKTAPAPAPTSNLQIIIVGLTQRPFTTPRLLLLRLWWGVFADFPLGGQKTAQTARPCGSRRNLPCARLWTAATASAQLPSLAVGSLSREPRTRPALPSIGHLHVSASPEGLVRGENSSHVRPLVTPKPPRSPPPDDWDSRAWDSMHLISVHACLIWTGSPCG